jgi:pilus assembly protein Flp/PilA
MAARLQYGRGVTSLVAVEDLMTMLRKFVREEEGVDLIEYALVAGLIAFGCVLAMGTLSGSLNGFFTSVGTKLDSMIP